MVQCLSMHCSTRGWPLRKQCAQRLCKGLPTTKKKHTVMYSLWYCIMFVFFSCQINNFQVLVQVQVQVIMLRFDLLFSHGSNRKVTACVKTDALIIFILVYLVADTGDICCLELQHTLRVYFDWTTHNITIKFDRIRYLDDSFFEIGARRNCIWYSFQTRSSTFIIGCIFVFYGRFHWMCWWKSDHSNSY